MYGYLRAASDSGRHRGTGPDADGTVVIDDRVLVYRQPDGTASVVAERDGEVVSLGLRDRTVSRRTNDAGEATYVEFFTENDQLYVCDHGSRNPTVLRDGLGEIELDDGTRYPLERDCTIELGYAAEVTVELTASAPEPSSDPWQAVQVRASSLETFLEDGSSHRLREHATALRDDLSHLKDRTDTTAEVEACLEDLDEFLDQLGLSQREGDPDASPDASVIRTGQQLTTRISGVVERQQ